MSICIILFPKLWTKYKRVQLNVGEDGGKALWWGWSGVMGRQTNSLSKTAKWAGSSATININILLNIANWDYNHALQTTWSREVISLQRFRHTDSWRGLWAERSLFLQLRPRLCIQLALGTSQGQITFNASESAEWLVNKFISNHFGSEYRIRRIWNSKLDNS